jgi:hypothetical protein
MFKGMIKFRLALFRIHSFRGKVESLKGARAGLGKISPADIPAKLCQRKGVKKHGKYS